MLATPTDVLIDAMCRLDPQNIRDIIVVLVSSPESDSVTITCISNMHDEIQKVGALDLAKDAILHPPGDQ